MKTKMIGTHCTYHPRSDGVAKVVLCSIVCVCGRVCLFVYAITVEPFELSL